MKYRKKPVVIEAFQLTEDRCLEYFVDKKELPFGVSLSGNYNPKERRLYSAYATINTLEGQMRAELNDWIIMGVKGELYPCKPDIFDMTYECIDAEIDEVLFYCQGCDEEYCLPEYTVICPICGNDWLAEINETN